jgi:hypothetical protein
MIIKTNFNQNKINLIHMFFFILIIFYFKSINRLKRFIILSQNFKLRIKIMKKMKIRIKTK